MLTKTDTTDTVDKNELPQTKTDTVSKNELLLTKTDRIALYPLEYPDFWDFYNNHKSSFWTAEEIDLSEDIVDWNKLSPDEKYYIEMVLGFFAASDFIVNEHISHKFIEKIQCLELKIYYRFQAMMEDIHSTTYADMINAYIKDPVRKEELFNAVTYIPCVTKKAEWARKYIYDSDSSIDETTCWIRRLIAFAAVEGIFFSGSFCSIFWLKKRGLMPGLTQSNELISRDEGIHRDIACYIYKNYIENKLEEKEILDIITDAVEIEKEFVSCALPVNLIGMNSTQMCHYIEYVADHLLLNMIGKRHYFTENPFEWMVLISMEKKTNFFEKRVSNYSKAEVSDISFNTPF